MHTEQIWGQQLWCAVWMAAVAQFGQEMAVREEAKVQLQTELDACDWEITRQDDEVKVLRRQVEVLRAALESTKGLVVAAMQGIALQEGRKWGDRVFTQITEALDTTAPGEAGEKALRAELTAQLAAMLYRRDALVRGDCDRCEWPQSCRQPPWTCPTAPGEEGEGRRGAEG